MNSLKKAICITLLFISSSFFCTQASVIINGTRVIYNAEENEATLRVNNSAKQPSLVQIWLDSGDSKSTPETGKSPFIATPPIFRVDPNKAQTVRIMYTSDPLPGDKESVFWINILDVPPMPVMKELEKMNYMQLAIRSRIKLFYRPKGLSGSPADAAAKVQWELIQKEDGVILRAKNMTPFHVSLDMATLTEANAAVNSAATSKSGKSYSVNVDMIKPVSSYDFLVNDLKKIPVEPFQLNYAAVNDFGSSVKYTASLTNTKNNSRLAQ